MSTALLVLAFALAQIVTAGFTQLTGLGEPVNVRAEALRNALTPAGYAFAIWGVIYLTNLILAIYQAMPVQWDKPEWRAARPWLILAFACNTVWQIIVPLYGLGLVSAAIIFVLAGSALAATRALQDNLMTAAALTRALVISPPALLTGWAIAASVVGFPSALIFEGLMTAGQFAANPAQIAIILVGLALGVLGLHAVNGAIATLAALAWGFVAVAVANRNNPDWATTGAVPLAVSVAILVIAAIALKFRRHYLENPDHAYGRRRHRTPH